MKINNKNFISKLYKMILLISMTCGIPNNLLNAAAAEVEIPSINHGLMPLAFSDELQKLIDSNGSFVDALLNVIAKNPVDNDKTRELKSNLSINPFLITDFLYTEDMRNDDRKIITDLINSKDDIAKLPQDIQNIINEFKEYHVKKAWNHLKRMYNLSEGMSKNGWREVSFEDFQDFFYQGSHFYFQTNRPYKLQFSLENSEENIYKSLLKEYFHEFRRHNFHLYGRIGNIFCDASFTQEQKINMLIEFHDEIEEQLREKIEKQLREEIDKLTRAKKIKTQDVGIQTDPLEEQKQEIPEEIEEEIPEEIIPEEIEMPKKTSKPERKVDNLSLERKNTRT